MTVVREPKKPGQESVWDYPRPPIAVPCDRHIVIAHRGITIADTQTAIRLLETSHPPSYYLPPTDVLMSALHPTDSSSSCEWKGDARYFDVVVAGQRLANVAWSYPTPKASFQALRDHVAFYAAPFDVCLVDGEQITPQPGGFYGGWITADVSGPFKGVPGSRLW